MARINLKQIAYNTIKEKIMNCEYEPSSFLNEDLLCKEMNMSRTPVRDALGRLEQEDLLKILPKKGFLISPLTIQDINTVYECRLLLEPYIIRNYCQHLPQQVLDRLQECLEKEEESIKKRSEDFYHWDNEFHICIQEQCSNNYFRKILLDVHSQNSRMHVLSGRTSDERLMRTVEEHKNILMAFMRNDVESAAKEMEQHLSASKDATFVTYMDKNSPLKHNLE